MMMALLSLGLAKATAQTDADGWMRNGRPENVTDVSIDANGVHRAPQRVGSLATAPLKATGTQEVPVVLVAFADKAFTAADSTDAGVNAYYELFCNGTMDGNLYTGHGSHGAVRDYFVEQSDSAFFPHFTVIGPVTLENGYATYGANSGSTRDTGYSQFRNEAITLAQEAYDGSWDDFDNDGNGTVDMIFFVYAGLGEHNGGDDDCLWAKESTAAVTINGTTYSCSGVTCECRTNTKDSDGNVLTTKTDGVGVFVHELSHALGLPDFYDTNSVAFGMDLWSVMDYGNYGNNGYNPGNYTAYERDFMGWRQVIDIEEPCILTIPCFADGGTGYRITNDENSDEYYIIENRQAKGWDDKVCTMGHGLQVTHVDYSASRWTSNTVNTDADHQRMTIIAANNSYLGTNSASSSSEWVTCLGGNLYPGTSLNYSLTDESTPAAEVYTTGSLMHKPIRDITENEDSTVTICFRTYGQLQQPEVTDATEDEETEAWTVEWGTVENATQYVCQLLLDDLVVSEDTLTDTQISYSGLSYSTTYSCQVKAMADTPEDYLDSEWSDPCWFTTSVDYITSVSESELRVDVYTLGGTLVSTCMGDEIDRLSLRKGIYIVRYRNGSARKVLIK